MQRNINNQYKLIRKLGKGGFASVYLLMNNEEHKFYAAKVFLKQKNLAKIKRISIKKEIQILQKLDHENIIKLKECFISDRSIYLITDYCSGPSLEQYIASNELKLSKQEIIAFMKQLLNAINYLHSKSIMHRDLKPANILFKSKECQELMIIDFGLAESINSKNYLFPRAGTPGYVAPEIANNILKESNYNEICDIFSLGCIMYLLITGQPLFQGENQSEIFEANKKCIIELDNDNCKSIDSELKAILSIMLKKDPEQRKNAQAILDMNIFDNFKKNQIDEFDNQILEQLTLDSLQNSNDILTKLEMFSEMQGKEIYIDYIKGDNFEDEDPTQLINSSKLLLNQNFNKLLVKKQQN